MRAAAAAVAAVLGLAGCGDSSTPQKRTTEAERTVTAFFRAIEQQRPLEACGLMTRAARARLVDAAGERVGATTCEGIMLQGAGYAEGIRIPRAAERDSTASVTAETQLGLVTFTLVRSPGGWRIDRFARG